MVESIKNFFTSIASLLFGFFVGLKNIIEFVLSGSTIIFTVLGYFPAIIVSFASLTVIILVIKFVIGRVN